MGQGARAQWQPGELPSLELRVFSDHLKIAALHRQALEAQQNQAAVDRALDYIEGQQKQLDQMMTHYEREIAAFSNDTSRPLAAKMPADGEREKTYVSISLGFRSATKG